MASRQRCRNQWFSQGWPTALPNVAITYKLRRYAFFGLRGPVLWCNPRLSVVGRMRSSSSSSMLASLVMAYLCPPQCHLLRLKVNVSSPAKVSCTVMIWYGCGAIAVGYLCFWFIVQNSENTWVSTTLTRQATMGPENKDEKHEVKRNDTFAFAITQA